MRYKNYVAVNMRQYKSTHGNCGVQVLPYFGQILFVRGIVGKLPECSSKKKVIILLTFGKKVFLHNNIYFLGLFDQTPEILGLKV